MKALVIFLIISLIIFVIGYALGRRNGKKEGYTEAQASFGLIMRQKILDSLNQAIDSDNIEAK